MQQTQMEKTAKVKFATQADPAVLETLSCGIQPFLL